MKHAHRLKITCAIALLVFQVGAIIHARFVKTRYFCWAPYDQISLFEIYATVDGKELPPEQIKDRYRLDQQGRNNHSIANIKAHLRQYETTYGTDSTTEIHLIYSLNGTEQQEWTWTE
jgi:hypothetical protein